MRRNGKIQQTKSGILVIYAGLHSFYKVARLYATRELFGILEGGGQ